MQVAKYSTIIITSFCEIVNNKIKIFQKFIIKKFLISYTIKFYVVFDFIVKVVYNIITMVIINICC